MRIRAMKREEESPDALEAKGQMRLITDLGPRSVPKWRKKGSDKGHADLPLFTQNDDRQLDIKGPR